ncbi:TPA: hypothetical protein N0F65_010231 [Lagenidium giganteum]|uniref:Uncharacterized protein n=1 Tax=Lagenidium giganteum TaxID=4803 RepID=A0AAV2Z194_9STRA|nr:TPA: hypothetical protein N0F65_010231 [Lagenidium giganteum]
MPDGVEPISADDYFLRATEFRVWLHQKRNKYVEELSTQEATELFEDKFVKRWNDGRLDAMFYKGIPEAVLEQTKRTRHQWGFVNRLNEKERFDLATAKDSVEVATRKQNLLQKDAAGTSSGSRKREQRDEDDRRNDRGYDDDRRHHDKADRKRHRKHHESVLEELVPKETGREAKLEQRRQRAEKLHGAARDRDANRDGLDIDEDFLMGGSSQSDLQRRLAQRQLGRERKDQERQEKVAALAAKETERMDKFLADMGLNGPGQGPIVIQPRR